MFFKGESLFSRTKTSFLVFIVMVFGLICRLTYLSIYKYEQYTSRVENQSTYKVNLNSGRGIIYDRNNIPLTDTEKKQIIIIPKSIISGDYKNINTIKKATNLSENDIFKAVQEQLNSELIEIEVPNLSEDSIRQLKKINRQKKQIVQNTDNLQKLTKKQAKMQFCLKSFMLTLK